MKKQTYYGIYFNNKIPKTDKINKFNKEVEIKFEGNAYLIKRNDNNEVIERKCLNTGYKLKKENDYEIEFINNSNQKYYLKMKIEINYLLFLLLLFIGGIMLGLILTTPLNDFNSILDRFYNYINLSIIKLDIDKNDISENVQYNFDVTFNNISTNDINLSNSISAKSLYKNKIAPGVSGSFSIVLSTEKSSVDMKYNIKFKDLTDEKPNNMIFKVRNSDKFYKTLQELEKSLDGSINKKSQKEIIIDWEWNYENGNDLNAIAQNDVIDTNDAKN